jgi:voltage-gated potassium channel
MSRPPGALRARLHEIIFEADTPEGRLFDLLLMVAILASVTVVLLESVASVRARTGPTLRALEWGFTILFTVEYILRLAGVRRPLRYARSALGIIRAIGQPISTQACPGCGVGGHEADAVYCRQCGTRL